MPVELILKNARLVMPEEIAVGDLSIENGCIAKLNNGVSRSLSGIDMEGDYLIPGITELHTDNLERHVMPRPGVLWPLMPALAAHDAQIAAAGITTVLDSLCVGMSGGGLRNGEIVAEAIALLKQGQQSDAFRAEHLLHLRVELSNERSVDEFSPFVNDATLRLVSLMDHTPGQRQWRDISKYIQFNVNELKKSYAETEAFVRAQVQRQSEYTEPNRRVVIEMLQGSDVRLASHDDTTEEHIEQAYAEGIHIAEFPTTLKAAAAARKRGMAIIAGAPNVILGGSHSGNVAVEDLAKHEVLDAMSSDYVPSSLIEAAFRLSKNLGLALQRTIGMITLTPSRLVGLNDRGAVAVGQRADLVRVREIDGLPIPVMVWRAGLRVL